MPSSLLGHVEAGLKDLMVSKEHTDGKENNVQPATNGVTADSLAAQAESSKHSSLGQPVNDREYTLEELIYEASAAPSGSRRRLHLAEAINSRLWDDLKHPPTSFLGKEFVYRAADGSGNVSILPHHHSIGSCYKIANVSRRMFILRTLGLLEAIMLVLYPRRLFVPQTFPTHTRCSIVC